MEVLPHFQLAADADDELRVLQLTDMHLFPRCTAWRCAPKGTFASRTVSFVSEGFASPLTLEPAAAMVRALITRSRPHVVVFTGDIVDGRPFGAQYPAMQEGKPVHSPGGEPDPFRLFATTFLQVLAPLLELGVPWCFCPGNHDDDSSPWTRADLLRTFKLPGCATPTATRFDHTLTMGARPEADERAVRLWIFDSGPNRKGIKYEPVATAAVNSYLELSRGLRTVAAELAFVHVPLPEYSDARILRGTCALFEARLLAGMLPQPWRSMPRCLARLLALVLGQDRAVGCSKVNTGLCAALAHRRTVRAICCGHNHFNDYVGVYGHLFLCFGRVSGISPPVTWEHDGGQLPFLPGGRVLAVRPSVVEHARVETWVLPHDSGDALVAGAEAAAELQEEDRIVLDPLHFGDHEGGSPAKRRRLLHLARLAALASSVTLIGALTIVATRHWQRQLSATR